MFLFSKLWSSIAGGCLKKTDSRTQLLWDHPNKTKILSQIQSSLCFYHPAGPILADPSLYACAAARNAYLVPLGVPACQVCPGSPVAPQVLALLWFLRCLGDLGDLVGPAGYDWSGSHLESDSASD